MKRKAKSQATHSGLAVVNPNAAAIDIGATMHVAAVGADRASDPVRSFGTFTADLHRLADWFAECGVKTIVMESTSVYWIPIFELLDERGFEVILVNARDAKHVPGRKTDVSDAQWLQRLHSYGLLRASFRPKGEIVELRAYLRQRERLLDTAASHIQHMQKAMTEMNLQLHHVVSDITGATGMRIIRAIIAGERDPAVLASMRDTRCHSSAEVIEKALTGHYRGEHLFVLEQALALYDVYQQKVAACDIRIESVLKELSSIRGRKEDARADGSGSPRRRSRQSNGPDFDVGKALHSLLGKDLTRIHGMGPYLALKLVSECGDDLSAWPSAKHFTSWLCLAPSNKISGGQGFVVENKTVRKPRCVASAIGRRDHWADRYRAGSILPATIRPCRKIESRHRDSPQDCRAVLQCAASRYGLRRSGGIILRDPLSGAGCQKSSSARQGLRIHSASSRDAGRRAGRFLGKLRRCWAPQRRATAGLDGRRGGSGAGQRLDRRRLHSAGAVARQPSSPPGLPETAACGCAPAANANAGACRERAPSRTRPVEGAAVC